MVKEHLSGYQARDYEVVDYQIYNLRGTELFFEGLKIRILSLEIILPALVLPKPSDVFVVIHFQRFYRSDWVYPYSI